MDNPDGVISDETNLTTLCADDYHLVSVAAIGSASVPGVCCALTGALGCVLATAGPAAGFAEDLPAELAGELAEGFAAALVAELVEFLPGAPWASALK
jgi:hypothetical protein